MLISHLKLLGNAGTRCTFQSAVGINHGGILPFAFFDFILWLLRFSTMHMCDSADAGVCMCSVQVQVQVQTCKCGCIQVHLLVVGF